MAETIFTLAILRLLKPCPFKRIESAYNHSFLSELYMGLSMSGKALSGFLRELGGMRDKMVDFFRAFTPNTECVLFDGTRIISQSEKMDMNLTGYNPSGSFDPQINLLYGFSSTLKMPVYYRIVAGSVPDVSAFEFAVRESKLQDVVVVADKGFGSNKNFELLENSSLRYIIPLKRNNTDYDVSAFSSYDLSDTDGHFMWQGRQIWFAKVNRGAVFLDRELQVTEERHYIERVEKNIEGYTEEGLKNKMKTFGTIFLKSNIDKTPQELYSIYKSRGQIEQTFDFLKNTLEQDKSYMQNDDALESWAFINHISLMLFYKLYNALREKDLLSKYSVEDLISELGYIHKARVDSKWVTTEVLSKTVKLLATLNIGIT